MVPIWVAGTLCSFNTQQHEAGGLCCQGEGLTRERHQSQLASPGCVRFGILAGSRRGSLDKENRGLRFQLDPVLAFGFVASIRICFSSSVFVSSSVFPAGKLLTFSR